VATLVVEFLCDWEPRQMIGKGGGWLSVKYSVNSCYEGMSAPWTLATAVRADREPETIKKV